MCVCAEEAISKTARVLEEADISEEKRDVIHREIGKFRESMKVRPKPSPSPPTPHTLLFMLGRQCRPSTYFSRYIISMGFVTASLYYKYINSEQFCLNNQIRIRVPTLE